MGARRLPASRGGAGEDKTGAFGSSSRSARCTIPEAVLESPSLLPERLARCTNVWNARAPPLFRIDGEGSTHARCGRKVCDNRTSSIASGGERSHTRLPNSRRETEIPSETRIACAARAACMSCRWCGSCRRSPPPSGVCVARPSWPSPPALQSSQRRPGHTVGISVVLSSRGQRTTCSCLLHSSSSDSVTPTGRYHLLSSWKRR